MGKRQDTGKLILEALSLVDRLPAASQERYELRRTLDEAKATGEIDPVELLLCVQEARSKLTTIREAIDIAATRSRRGIISVACPYCTRLITLCRKDQVRR